MTCKKTAWGPDKTLGTHLGYGMMTNMKDKTMIEANGTILQIVTREERDEVRNAGHEFETEIWVVHFEFEKAWIVRDYAPMEEN